MKLSKWIVGLAWVFLSGMAWGQTIAPDVLVKNTTSEVLEIIKKDKDIQSGDLKKITALAEEKILPHFDFEAMSRAVLGKNWREASKEQQAQFVTEFRTLLVRTYASALAKYRNQTIEYKPLRAEPSDTRVTVKTQIIQPGGPPLPVDYTLKLVGDAWKVVDVTIEGVSLVTNYRGQFANELKQTDIAGLIQRIAEKNKSGTVVEPKKQG
ncbi:MAG: ABC transporter substrate-binding protein [Methylophilaceae bacterium]|nr:ABC transporter substrate-binding protein [Methylophilaceae bacterium]